MRVFGIDPGFGRCGVAVVEKSGSGKEILLYSDCIVTLDTGDFSARLGAIQSACRELIATWQPERVALEKLFFTKNAKTAMRVAEARGSLLAMVHENGLPVREYTPNEVKVAVTGSGRADKEQVASMVARLVAMRKIPKYDDEYDAIAVALTDLASR